ncbi:MAG: tetratricopeptide repeat protein [Phycisphaeraceae bacterium]|nr:tetratricopeptide repeat protein [Phycisphaeraceae bacterium]
MSRLDKLKRLLEVDPADPFVLYGIAQEQANAGNYAEAITFYDRCLAADPAYCYAYFHKARAQQALGQIEAAIVTTREGEAAARAAGDGKASGELASLLDELS